MPDLTVLLDMDPVAGLSRHVRSADRLEAEPAEFHRRVRHGFLALAHSDPDRYLVLDASAPPGQVTELIKDRIRELLPDPVPRAAEASTGSFPAVPGVPGVPPGVPDGPGFPGFPDAADVADRRR
jgi:dTMP kinase